MRKEIIKKYSIHLITILFVWSFLVELITKEYVSVTIVWTLGAGLIIGMALLLAIKYLNHKKNIELVINKSNRLSEFSTIASEGIIIHDKQILIDANETLCKLLDYTAEELNGVDIYKKMVALEYQTIAQNSLQKSNSEPIKVELLKKYGTSVFAEMNTCTSMYCGKNVLVTYVRKVEKPKTINEDFLIAKQKLELHFSNTPLAVIEWNLDYKVTRWNTAAERIFGFTAEEIIGKHSYALLEEDLIPLADDIFADLLAQKGGSRSTNANVTKSGKKIWCEWYNTPLIDEKGQVVGVASLAQDITDRKIAEISLINKNQELEAAEEEIRASLEEVENKNQQLIVKEGELIQAKFKAEESERLKSAFLANMSHEIRTPMNGILGFTQLLALNKNLDEKSKKHIEIIESCGDQLLNIVDDILNISKIETGVLSVNIEEVNVVEFLKELHPIFEVKSINNNNTLKLVYDNNSSNTIVNADKTRLRQILSNLLTNALKFTDNGTVEYGFKVKHKQVMFFVKDTGVGIPVERQATVFERFTQVEPTTSEIKGGVGLGLAISKGLVKLMDGKIWVESELNKGSVFYFTLPFVSKNNAKHLYNTNTENVQELDLTGVNILVAEDNPTNHLVIEHLLSETNANITKTYNGKEAVDMFNSLTDFHLVLMDIKMPVLNGFDAALAIKTKHPEIPIIAQTAFALDENKEEFMDARFENYLTKPIKRDNLFTAIKMALGVMVK